MKYHDYQLREYEVSDFGKRVTLRLVYDYPERPYDESHIEFSGVSLYNFTHTAGSIITDLEEVPLAQLVKEIEPYLEIWSQQQGIEGWRDTAANYRETLQEQGQRSWRIDSAIGFSGFIIARSVAQLAPNKSLHPPPDASVTALADATAAPDTGAGELKRWAT